MKNEILDQCFQDYVSGRVVPVSRSVVKKALAQADETLGLKPQKYDKFKIVPLSLEEVREIGKMAGVSVKDELFVLGDQIHEAVLLHEATHYVMGKRNLWLNPDPYSWFLYEELINETIAEAVAGEVYGLRDTPKINGLERIGERDSVKTLDELAKGGCDLGSEVAIKHRIFERYFLENDEETLATHLSPFIEDLYKKMDHADEKTYQEYMKGVTFLAHSNAFKLNKKGIKVAGIIKDLKESIANQGEPMEFYFDEIVKKVGIRKLPPSRDKLFDNIVGPGFNQVRQ